MTSERRGRCAAWLLSFLVLAISTPVRASGNVTSTGGKSFTYDSENHLMSMNNQWNRGADRLRRRWQPRGQDGQRRDNVFSGGRSESDVSGWSCHVDADRADLERGKGLTLRSVHLF